MPIARNDAPGDWRVDVDASAHAGPAYRFWTVSNFTSQHMFADPEGRQQVRRPRPYIRYVNTVRLMGGRHDGRNAYFKGVRDDGTLDCDFTDLVAYLQGMLDLDLTPRIVLDNVPTAMSEPEELHVYGNTLPPKDEKVWHRYVQLAVQAMVNAFGLDQVRSWRFRVGTEPDLFPGHWSGTKEQYLLHYDATADAVLSVIPDADIGPGNILNPTEAGANADSTRTRWGLDIIDHAATGTNRWTGKTGTALRRQIRRGIRHRGLVCRRTLHHRLGRCREGVGGRAFGRRQRGSPRQRRPRQRLGRRSQQAPLRGSGDGPRLDTRGCVEARRLPRPARPRTSIVKEPPS